MVLLRKGGPPAQRSLLRLPTPDGGGATAREGPEADGGRVPESVPVRKAVDRGRALGPRSSLPWSSTTRETAWSACLTGRGPVGAAADPSTLTRSASLLRPPRGRHPQCGYRSWWYSSPHARAPSGRGEYPSSADRVLWQTCAAACADAHPCGRARLSGPASSPWHAGRRYRRACPSAWGRGGPSGWQGGGPASGAAPPGGFR